MTGDPLLCFFLLLLCIFILCFHGVEPSFPSSCFDTVCNGVNISYPFWLIDDDATTPCGYPGFGLSCPDGNDPDPILALPGDSYYVKHINYSTHSITLVDMDVVGKSCPRAMNNVSIDSLPLDYSPGDVNITFYFNCTVSNPPLGSLAVPCFGEYMGKISYAVLEGTVEEPYYWWGWCEEVVVATVKETEVSEAALISQFSKAMSAGFVLDWDTAKDCGGCEVTNGRCGFDNRTEEFLCFCADGKILNNASRTFCKGTGPMNCISPAFFCYRKWFDHYGLVCRDAV